MNAKVARTVAEESSHVNPSVSRFVFCRCSGSLYLWEFQLDTWVENVYNYNYDDDYWESYFYNYYEDDGFYAAVWREVDYQTYRLVGKNRIDLSMEKVFFNFLDN